MGEGIVGEEEFDFKSVVRDSIARDNMRQIGEPSFPTKELCDSTFVAGNLVISCGKEIGHNDDEHEVILTWARETPRKDLTQ